jgi:glycosyltransferase involved in cell wall biosynthesis
MESTRPGPVLMIVPTYNERENLPALIRQLRGLPDDLHVLVVDDASPDGTGDLADTLAAQDAGVAVLHRSGKLGLGTAYRAGFAYGLARDYQVICTMDADFSHNPASVPALLVKLQNGYDLVVGSRYVPGGRVAGWPRMRKLLSFTANWLVHLFLGVTTRDCTAGFRCYRRRVLETIPLDTIFSSGYSFLIEMAFLCQQAGFRIGEVPITFVNRTQGASKISKVEIVRAMYTLLRLRTRTLPWERWVDLYHHTQREFTAKPQSTQRPE